MTHENASTPWREQRTDSKFQKPTCASGDPDISLGTQQAGFPKFHFADLARDGALITAARREAQTLLSHDPNLTAIDLAFLCVHLRPSASICVHLRIILFSPSPGN